MPVVVVVFLYTAFIAFDPFISLLKGDKDNPAGLGGSICMTNPESITVPSGMDPVDPKH